MGIHDIALDFLYKSLEIAGCESLQGKWLLELGNQAMRGDAKKKYGFRSGCSKVYFLNLRCNHHSIDWNGQDGAVPLDMTKPMPIKRYINAFDIVTDFGCMEHYGGNHWQAWKNIHDMGKVGCVYIHMVPLIDSFPRHGAFHYNMEFFEKLCKANSYRSLLLNIQSTDPRTWKRDYVMSSYIKVEGKPFAPEPKEFKEWLHR